MLLRHSCSIVCCAATLAVLGCGDDSGEASSTTGQGGAGGSGGQGGASPACGSAAGVVPAIASELAWDDGIADTSLREQDFSIDVQGQTFVLNEEPIHEAVRFDLEHPARVYAFSIAWAGLSPGAPAETELSAGLYSDFGHNGFDFWAETPIFSGTRCAGDIGGDGFLTYVLDTPLEVTHPGLVYVAHLAEPGAPVFAFDGTTSGDGTCALWDDCHSSLNLPEAFKSTFYNGVSFPFQYDFLVRLHYEYTDEVVPSERLFQPVDFPPSAHASFADYDADGFDDLLTEGPRLWRNQGDGTFVEATASSGIAALGVTATGGVFGDYDNDGCLDLFLFAESYSVADTLLHSGCDGTFTDVTAAAQIVDLQAYEPCEDPVNNVRSPTAAAAWVDMDGDGFLDLYESNFICWALERFYVDTVWRNVGDGTFEEWTGTHGFLSTKTPSRGAAPADFDDDGDVDIFVNNYRLKANLLFVNDGAGNFVESALARGVAGDPVGIYFGHTIGAAWGDLDGDGRLDLVSANLAHPRFFDFSDRTEILLQQSNGTFIDLAKTPDLNNPAGLRYQETYSVPALSDFDRDGNLDLVLTAVYEGRPTDFYWGNGDGTFTLDAYHAGITTENGWGVAVADLENDGDSDVFAHQPFVYAGADTGHWVQIKAVGNGASNRAAIGATVRVTAGGVTRTRLVDGGTGKGGQSSMYLPFGLGAATSVDEVRVRFPGGTEVVFPGPLAVDQRIWVYEDGSVALGWSQPT